MPGPTIFCAYVTRMSLDIKLTKVGRNAALVATIIHSVEAVYPDTSCQPRIFLCRIPSNTYPTFSSRTVCRAAQPISMRTVGTERSDILFQSDCAVIRYHARSLYKRGATCVDIAGERRTTFCPPRHVLTVVMIEWRCCSTVIIRGSRVSA